MKEDHHHHQDEEESLSLCDLPINKSENNSTKDSPAPPPASNNKINNVELEEDFKFCHDPLISREDSEMCVADEVFFQGQILPFRHSVSGGGIQSDMIRNAARRRSFSISRSDSLDQYSYSDGLTSGSSTRSSSINSHHSSSTSSAANSKHTYHLRPPRVKNQFQYYYSHPSPKPQIRSSSIKNRSNSSNYSNKKSGLWSLFRLGLMTTPPPPKIAIQDLKNRSNSRNSNISFSSSSSSKNSSATGKKKPPFFLFGGSCKCTTSSVALNRTRQEEAVNEKFLSEPGPRRTREEEKEQHAMSSKKKTKHGETRKELLSRHRTFEWLKQLSLEDQM